MTMTRQRRLAIAGAALAAALFVAANAHLITVAFNSQPTCVAADPDSPPAKKAC